MHREGAKDRHGLATLSRPTLRPPGEQDHLRAAPPPRVGPRCPQEDRVAQWPLHGPAPRRPRDPRVPSLLPSLRVPSPSALLPSVSSSLRQAVPRVLPPSVPDPLSVSRVSSSSRKPLHVPRGRDPSFEEEEEAEDAPRPRRGAGRRARVGSRAARAVGAEAGRDRCGAAAASRPAPRPSPVPAFLPRAPPAAGPSLPAARPLEIRGVLSVLLVLLVLGPIRGRPSWSSLAPGLPLAVLAARFGGAVGSLAALAVLAGASGVRRTRRDAGVRCATINARAQAVVVVAAEVSLLPRPRSWWPPRYVKLEIGPLS